MAPPVAVDPRVVADNVRDVRNRITALGGRDVRIIAVTKGFGLDAALAAMAAGCHGVGENYAQEVVAKFGAMESSERPAIHFIGHLQSNKVEMLAPLITIWQSVDRPSIATAIGTRRPGAGVLIQVNATGESNKGGCRPADTGDLIDHATRQGLEVRGLMTIGPTDGDRDRTAEAFATVADLRVRFGLAELSMGMTDDMDLAVPLGATMVRIGRALFGRRPPKKAPDH
ncbi:MAG: YggS family pyridoxal phosphate-dependent enzyme [Ilumatobacteraceae bacterium]